MALAAVLSAGFALAQDTAPVRGLDTINGQPVINPGGYIPPEQIPSIAEIIPPPPALGSPRQLQDMEVFKATRQLEGSPRWQAALADDVYRLPTLLADFNCAIGANLDELNAPKTTAILRRMLIDTGNSSASAKVVFQRKRPYQIVGEGNICIEKSERLGNSPDYPSGHATLGWTAGLILAELAPDRAAPIMARARAFTESRVICGVHSPSAIEAGRSTGSAVLAAMHGSAEFRADLEVARAEIAAARQGAAKPDAGLCKAQTELLSRANW
ncbi:phosphatase PAP2 family protein [soil metagenome]